MIERIETMSLRAISRTLQLNRPTSLSEFGVRDRIAKYLLESRQRMSSMKSSLALTNLSSFKVLRNVVAKNVWL